MPVYTYRREDGTTFDYRQKFLDEPLKVDPETGQRVSRVVQAAGIIFKGSGFYVNDSKSASRSSLSHASKPKDSENSEASKSDSTAPAAEKKSEATTEAKTEAKAEKKVETKSAAAD